MQIKQVFEHYARPGPATGEFEFCPFCGTTLHRVESGGELRPTCPTCGFVQYRNPAPTVSVLVVDGGRVLLGQRGGELAARDAFLISGLRIVPQIALQEMKQVGNRKGIRDDDDRRQISPSCSGEGGEGI
jgi:hypothetical protein